MKQLICGFALLLTFSLFAQTEKGAAGARSLTGDIVASTGTTYAVVVGISDYQDEGIPDLRFADKDAEAFAGFLQSPAGGSLDDNHLKVLTNDHATGAQVFTALDWLTEVAGEGDRVIIYFSGHGDVEAKRISQPGYLLGWDAPSRVYAAGGTMNIRDFQDYISTLSVYNKAKVVVITDACRSGKLSGSDIGGAQLTSQNLARQYENEIKILSCQPNEYSIEGEQWGGGRGAFSYHLLDGLMGLADRNTDQSVNLMEIRSYLEENVSVEVAPQNQLPMVVGNGREKLVDVLPELLEQIKEGKKGQMQLFTSTESRGIEEEVLAPIAIGADSNIVEMYWVFQESLVNQNFLCDSTDWCADRYYEKLSKEPKLEKLHSTMRRNYAAALQDDAQQDMNTLLKSGLNKSTLKNERGEVSFKDYPAHLQRASELLGKEHYMYNKLQARKLYFKAMSQKNAMVARTLFHRALAIEPDMPHAVAGLILTFGNGEHLDSAEYYFQKAIEMIPSWIEPYINLSSVYRGYSNLEKAEEILRRGGIIDSSSVKIWYYTANNIKDQGNYEGAKKLYKRVIEATAQDICFPCASNNLGWIYYKQGQYEEAEKHFIHTIKLDSTFALAYGNLSDVYIDTRRYEKAEKYLKKVLELDSTKIIYYAKLAIVYLKSGRSEEAETLFHKIKNDSTDVNAYYQVGFAYHMNGFYEEAEKVYQRAVQIDPTFIMNYYQLACLQSLQNNVDSAFAGLESALEKGMKDYRLLQTDSDLAPLRERKKQWEELMKKYFPDRFED